MYIFGSIHRPYTSLWPQIPRNVKKAFKSSKKLYLEIDVTNSITVSRIMRCMILPNHQTLVDMLPTRVYNKLENYLTYFRSQIPKWLNENKVKDKMRVENPDEVYKEMTKHWRRKWPIWIFLMLNSFNKESVQTRTILKLDSYMYLKAWQMNKSIGYLESVEERCRLSYLNSSQVCMLSR